MAEAKQLQAKDERTDNFGFPNFFKQKRLVFPILPASKESWFWLDGFACDRHVYLYLVGDSFDQDVDIVIHRSAGVFPATTNQPVAIKSNNSDFSVQIPGGSGTISAVPAGDVDAIDFNLFEFGADRLWIKVTTGAYTKGTLKGYLLIKQDK